jgi:nucleotide-binding universal stress UspA family protein
MAARIVVGIDGSEHSAEALRWAVEEARLRGATVEAVHAWSYVPVAMPADGGLVPIAWTESTEVFDATRGAAEQMAVEQVRSVVGDENDVVVTVVQGDATDALLDACEGADLLVVGNRGRGSFTQALLGSTSGKVSDRAPCPVVVVRAHPHEDDA